MPAPQNKKYFTVSIISHILLLMLLVLGFDFATPLPVLENTNKNDVISAVVLGDTPKSNILPQQTPAPPPPSPVQEIVKEQPLPPRETVKTAPLPKPKPVQQVVKEEPKPHVEPKPKVINEIQIKKDAIALKALEKKKLAELKKLQEKMQHELLAKDLLADMAKLNKQQKQQQEKQKKVSRKELQQQFQKTLREQAEKSLRQQLLNEEIKLQGAQSRQAQGVVNKYKALILQAISEHWLVPTQANKSLYSELMIRVAPGGVVLDVQITKSSGDPSLDSSARAAVLKASPLPVPSDPAAFTAFRQFVLKVKPENILANS